MAKKITRDTELCRKKKIEDKLLDLYNSISDGYIAQASRADDTQDYWDLYNSKLGNNQYYNGTSKIFVPLVHDAVNARSTRFVNQVFPKGGRFVEVVSSDGSEPYAIMALLEHYVRKSKLRTEVAPALCVSGDIEGQYNVYVEWSKRARHVTWIEKKPVQVAGVPVPQELEDGVDEIVNDVVLDEHPIVEVLPDADVLILPVTSDSVEEALANGGSVTIIRRWTKGQLEKMKDDGEVDHERAQDLLDEMDQVAKQGEKNPPKKHADAAGIKAKGKICQGYETWTKVKIDDDFRLCRVFYGGEKTVLSCKLNPNWSDRCPLISVPVKKVAGVAKGISQVQPCAQMQYAANDALNEGMDSAAYALLPIIATDPLKNPKFSTMIMDLAAVWEVDPNSTKFMQFPQLWKDAFEIVAACKMQIFQSLSVTPAMMPQGTGGRAKRNQAEIAIEQQVDILTTADAVTVMEDVYTGILERFAEMDAQYRRDSITIKQFGYLGMKASMERVPPLQLGTRYQFLWFGVEQARNVAQLQQQIALVNVVKGIPPQMLPGRRLNLVPAIEHAMSSTFGPRIAPLVFEDLTSQFSYPPEAENEILATGQLWPVSPLDDDTHHMQVHTQGLKDQGDPSGALRKHIAQHRMAQIQKAMAAQQQGAQPGLPGSPGGAGPGVAGTPQPGAQPGPMKNVRSQPGAMHADRMPAAGAVGMPRKM